MDKAVGNQHLLFTAYIRTYDTNPPPSVKKKKVQTVENDELPFLGMKMSWSPEGGPAIWSIHKEGSAIKVLR